MKSKQTFEIVNANFFKSTLHNVYIELSSKYVGGRGKFCSPERK